MDGMILISIALPTITGILLLLNSFIEHLKVSGTIGKKPVVKKMMLGIIMLISACFTMAAA